MDNFGRSRGIGGFSMIPPVMKSLIIINVIVYFVMYFFLESLKIGEISLYSWFMHYFALQPFNSLFGGNFWPWQLFSYQFMHGGFFHLFFNMFSLWMFGAELESMWGSKRFLIYYVTAGIGAGIVQLIVGQFLGQLGPTIGASGSIYGILLAFGMTFPDRQIMMFPLFIPIKAKYFVILFAGIEMISGFGGSDGVAHFAHLGGAATGFLLLKFGERFGFFKLFEKIGSKKQETVSKGNIYNLQRETGFTSSRTSYQEPTHTSTTQMPKTVIVNGEVITQTKIDAILDKISASGYANLSDHEKFILTELSKKL